MDELYLKQPELKITDRLIELVRIAALIMILDMVHLVIYMIIMLRMKQNMNMNIED